MQAALREVVAVQRHVERADGRALVLEGRDEVGQPRGQRHAAALDADEHEIGGAGVRFDDLVRQAVERAAYAVAVEHRATIRLRRRGGVGLASGGGASVRHNKPSHEKGRVGAPCIWLRVGARASLCPFPASQDRVKEALALAVHRVSPGVNGRQSAAYQPQPMDAVRPRLACHR